MDLCIWNYIVYWFIEWIEFWWVFENVKMMGAIVLKRIGYNHIFWLWFLSFLWCQIQYGILARHALWSQIRYGIWGMLLVMASNMIWYMGRTSGYGLNYDIPHGFALCAGLISVSYTTNERSPKLKNQKGIKWKWTVSRCCR